MSLPAWLDRWFRSRRSPSRGAEGSAQHFFDRLAVDVRHSLRVLGKAPLFTAVALLSLALGIGANTAIFTIVHAVMLEALPVREPGQLVHVTIGERRPNPAELTNPIWEAIRDHLESADDGSRWLESAFAVARVRFDLAAGGEKQFVEGLYVSGDFFRTLGVQPFAGRTLEREDDRRGGGGGDRGSGSGGDGPVAVLGHDFWRTRYQASRDVIGRPIHLNGRPFTIVGVMPPGFFGVHVGSRFDVAVPLAAEALIASGGSMLNRRGNWWIEVMGRLSPGTSRERAEAALRALAPRIREATMPESYMGKERDGYLADPFRLVPAAGGASPLRARYRTALLALTGAVGLVLLVACANLANLLLARASARQREFALRLALGASRARLVRQLLTESLLLAFAGAALGLVVARVASDLIVRQISSARAPLVLDLSLDSSILLFTMIVAALTAVVFGLAPAFRATDLRAQALITRDARSLATGWRGFRLEKLLVAVQIAVSLVLVLGGALFVRSFTALATLDPGFDQRQVLVASVDARRIRGGGTTTPVWGMAGYQRLLEATRSLPDVRAAALTAQIPITNNTWMSGARVEGREQAVFMNRVSSAYFETLGTPVLAGRDFGTQDTPEAPGVAIVNELFARTFFGDASPIGRTFDLSGSNAWQRVQIVGVVKDSKYLDLRQSAPQTVYLAMSQFTGTPTYLTLLVRGTGDASALARPVTGTARRLNPELSLDLRAFQTIVDESLTQERLLAMLSGFFGILALLVAGIGLYGMMSLAVARRRREIGIRMALGARASTVVSMVLRDVAIVTAAGLALGVLSGLWSGRFVRTLLFGLEPNDTTTWLLAIAALGAAAGLAGFLPARRAAKLDPMLALRED